MNTSLIALVVGMFGSEFGGPKDGKPVFGMTCGQMRSTEHSCSQCGLIKSWNSRISGPPQLVKSTGYHDRGRMIEQYPLARCHCTHFVPPCEKIGHNHGWFNGKGEKVGWGDTCACDMKRIAKESADIMYFLSEMDSHWEMQRNRIKNPTMTDIEYVREKAVWAIVPPHHIPRHPGTTRASAVAPCGTGEFAETKIGMFNFIHMDNYRTKVGEPNTKQWGALTFTEIHPDDMKKWGV